MKFNDYQIDFYIDKLKNNEPFSIGMYGDGEWQCIFNKWGRKFKENCEKTVYTKELTDAMVESLKFNSPNFYFATDDFSLSGMGEYNKMIDEVQELLKIDIDFVNKHIWHVAMYEARLTEFIKALLEKNVCIVSNKMLRGLTFLKYDKFVEIDYPNCYKDLERATKECLDYGKEGIYIFACGIPATLFVQRLHNKIPNSWFLDLGSIWDAFVGIGGQRPTRREWYLNPEEWKQWRNDTLKGIKWETKELPVVEWYGMGSKDINKNL